MEQREFKDNLDNWILNGLENNVSKQLEILQQIDLQKTAVTNSQQ